MFRKTKLGTKLAIGFGAMIVLVVLIGTASGYGVRSMNENIRLSAAGEACLAELNNCATQRRDFAIHGFSATDAAGQNPAEKWQESYDSLTSQLAALQGDEGLKPEHRQRISELLSLCDTYEQAFRSVESATTERNAAFKEWGRVGGAVTQAVEDVIANVIEPALRAAEQSQNAEELKRWNRYANTLNTDVIQRFLLLRVTAVYLLATNADPQWEAYQAQLATTMKGLESWRKDVAGNTELESVAQQVAGLFAEYEQAGKNYRQGILQDRESSRQMQSAATAIVTTMGKLRDGLMKDMTTVSARTNATVIGMALGATLLGILLAVVIARAITKPINRIIASLTEGASQVTDAANQVSTASQQLAEGASEQASSLEETSSALEEMAAMTRTNAENAKQANALSDQARDAAQSGDQTMARLNEAMAGINSSAGEISKIIKVIEEIAFQTNLLALNAAVEAARAGEHGKGFAVVAEEVRNLAQRAAQAARETTGLIEESVQRAKDGTEVAGEVGESLGRIVSDVARVTELIEGIARASNEQAQGVEQVNVAVSQMDKVTQANAAGAEESASAAEELSAQAIAVNSVVDELAALVHGAKRPQGGVGYPAGGATSGSRRATQNLTGRSSSPATQHLHFGHEPTRMDGTQPAQRATPLESHGGGRAAGGDLSAF